jgi:hypothetical protein
VQKVLAFLAVVSFVSGCAAAHAKRDRRRAEYAMGGSLLGVMAGGLTIAAWPAQKEVLIPITIGFGVLAVASTIAYVVIDTTAD